MEVVERLAVCIDRGTSFLGASYVDDGDFANKCFPKSGDQSLSLQPESRIEVEIQIHTVIIKIKALALFVVSQT